VDFPLDQLDTKKKVRPKLGEGILMRLRFVQSAAQREGAGAVPGGGKDGYALVSSDGEAHEEGGAVNVGGEAGVEMAGVTAAKTSSAKGSSAKASPSKPMAVSSAAAAPSGSAKSKKTEAAFTSLVSGNKGGSLEQIVL
jgi:hypothetical protein